MSWLGLESLGKEGRKEGREKGPVLVPWVHKGPEGQCVACFSVCLGEGGNVLVLGWAMAQGSGSRILKGGCPLLL